VNARATKTRSEQVLDWLEHVGRPLTDAESADLQRALHAIYCRNRKLRIDRELTGDALAKDAAENAKLLERVEAEILMARLEA
jgi:hypothetical protein